MIYLNESGVILSLFNAKKGLKKLQKPSKIYLNNTCLHFALSPGKSSNIGNMQETFLFNTLSAKHELLDTDLADFLVDNEFILEVGGKNKDYKQIKNLDNAYLVTDDIETGYKNRIPLWLFGFIY